MITLSGQKALVTGGAQGIGATICRTLAAAGAEVAVVDFQTDKLDELALQNTTSGGRIVPVVADISTEDACRSAVSEAVDHLGSLDIIINNAAPKRNRNTVGELNNADWKVHEQIVLSAVVNIIDAAEEHLGESDNASIVNISSVVSQRVATGHCSWAYHASKAGLDHLTRWLAVRLGPKGIRVNAVAPGLIDRDGIAAADHDSNRSLIADSVIPLQRGGTTKEVSDCVLFLCSPYASYITGQIIVVDGGLNLSETYDSAARMYEILQASSTSE